MKKTSSFKDFLMFMFGLVLLCFIGSIIYGIWAPSWFALQVFGTAFVGVVVLAFLVNVEEKLE